MKKLLALFAVITIIFLNAEALIKELPSSDFKLKISLLMHKSKIEDLISILDNTEYTNIFWIKDRELNAGIRTQEGLKWDKTAALDAFINKAEEYNYQNLLTSKNRYGNWLLSGYKDIEFLNEAHTQQKTITVDYSYGKKPELSLCNSEIIESSTEGQCYLPLFENWYIYKYWFTYDLELEQT